MVREMDGGGSEQERKRDGEKKERSCFEHGGSRDFSIHVTTMDDQPRVAAVICF